MGLGCIIMAHLHYSPIGISSYLLTPVLCPFLGSLYSLAHQQAPFVTVSLPMCGAHPQVQSSLYSPHWAYAYYNSVITHSQKSPWFPSRSPDPCKCKQLTLLLLHIVIFFFFPLVCSGLRIQLRTVMNATQHKSVDLLKTLRYLFSNFLFW